MNIVTPLKSQKTLMILRFLAACFLLVSVFTPQGSLQAAQSGQEDTKTIQIVMAPPDTIQPEDIPQNLKPFEAREFAGRLLKDYAAPVREILAALKAEGVVSEFTFQPDKFGFEVKTTDAARLSQALNQSREAKRVASVAPEADSKNNTCAPQSLQRLANQVRAFSLRLAPNEQSLAQNVVSNPHIRIQMDSTGYADYFNGYVAPNKYVTFQLKRGGVVVATRFTKSDSGGYYYFYADWTSCPVNGDAWDIYPGDEVIVNDTLATYSTIAVSLNGWLDPTQNLIYGKTEVGRKVNVTLYYQKTLSDCYYYTVNYPLTTNASGEFIGTLLDFNHRAFAYVEAVDAGGNISYTNYDAFYLNVYQSYNVVAFQVKPQVDFTANLVRGGSIIETKTGQTDESGDAYAVFTTTFQAGDVIGLAGGDQTMIYTYWPFTAVVNGASNWISGQFGPNYYVGANQYHLSSYYYGSTCNYGEGCRSTPVGSNGIYTIGFPNDLISGDSVYVYGWNAEGNGQFYGYVYTPAIVARLDNSRIEGQWIAEDAPIIVRHYSSGGSLLQEDTFLTDYDATFFDNFHNILPGDKLEVTDGTTTRSMTVADFTAAVPYGGNTLTGKTPSGVLVAEAHDQRPLEDSTYYTCWQSNTSAGNYSHTFPYTLRSRDNVTVSIRDASENMTSQSVYMFEASLQKNMNYLYGWTVRPNLTVTMTQTHNGAQQAQVVATSGSNGYFTMTTNQVLSFGDALKFTVNDGTTVNTTVSALEVSNNTATQSVEGGTNILWPVEIDLFRHYGPDSAYSSYAGVYTWANMQGLFSVPYAGRYWGRDCSPVNATDACLQVAAYVTADDGITTYQETPYPSSPAPDQYEPSDNTQAGATPAGLGEIHSLHAGNDIDWYKLTVNNVNPLGTPLYLSLRHYGWDAMVKVSVYREGDTNPVTTAWMGDWEPEWTAYLYQSGTYYISAETTDPNSAPACDAYYQLLVSMTRIFLPTTIR